VTPISIVVDYKPGMRAGSFSALMATGDYMYMLKMVPLEQSSVELRRLRLRNVLAANWSTLAMQRYFPNYDRSHLARLLVGVQPVHVAFKLGAGAADLVRVPLAEYRRGGSVVAGLQAGVKTLTVEVLTLGSRVSSVAARLLGGGSDTAALRGADGSANDEALQRISRYANQPATVNEGVQQAVEQLRDGVLSGLRAVAVDPINAYQRDGAWAFLSSAVSGVPRLVLRPAMGVSSAIAKVTQGVRNQLEPERKREADQKWKAANDDAQLDDFEM
jgi:autophagy-related protein 2